MATKTKSEAANFVLSDGELIASAVVEADLRARRPSGVLVGSWWHAVDTLGLAGGSAVPGGGSAPGCVEGDVIGDVGSKTTCVIRSSATSVPPR
jgi:hypothetical protein